MIHITMTGLLAGKPLCTIINPGKTFGDDDTFQHVPYNHRDADALMVNPDLCPTCKEEWEG